MKTHPLVSLLVGALVACLPSALSAYTFFEDNFESAPDPGPNAEDPLLGNGMVVGATVFNASNSYLYNYFAFPAPNVTGDGARFCNVASLQGGPDQGAKVLSVFSDYNNGGAHAAGDLVDSNVYVEFFLEEADLGTTVTFQYDAKFGDFDPTPLTGADGSAPPYPPEAEVFLKVLDPSDSYSTSVIDAEDATQFPTLWGTYFLTIAIPNDPAWVGRLLQAGFRNKTSLYHLSTIYYDNLFLTSDRVFVEPPPIKIVSLTRTASADEFAIVFEAEVGAFYELQKLNPATEMWEYVFDIEAFSTEELLDDVDATEPTALYRIVKADP